MDLFTLSAKLTLDTSEYEKGLKGAEKTGSKSGSSIGDAFTKIGNVAKKGLQVAATAITAAGTAIVGLTTSSVKAYAQYEQLVGGVETLFGTGGKTLAEYQKTVGVTTESTRKQVEQSVKDYQNLQKAQSDVMKNAKDAYRTAGLDMNTYMETVTGFSASLIQSLGGDTVKAAEYANRAIVDMSDNANKMGTNIESIQNAYQGFAKQNYTMLDNLKLGYGGTKSEMERLIEDASKMTDVQEKLGITVDKNSLSFANIVNAISVMQEHLGIAGTTSKEAATTIQGSIGMMRAAWENLKISIADPEGNVPEALDTFVQSAGTAAKNLVPVVGNALKGIGTVIKDLAPIIGEEIPKLTSEILPDLISGAVALLSGITKAIIENGDMIIDGFGQILEGIGSELQKSDNPVLKGVGKLVSFIGDIFRSGSIEEAWDKLWTGVKNLGAQLWEDIKSNMTKVWESIKSKATELWEGIKTAVTDAIESAKTILGTLWEGIKTFATTAWENIKSTATSIWNAISLAVTTAIETASAVLGTLWEGIKTVAVSVWDTISSVATTVWNAISSAITTAIETASTVLSTLWEGIKSVAVSVWDTISSVATTIWNAISNAITTAIDTASTVLGTLWDGIQSAAETVWNAISSTATSVWDGIKSAITSAVEAVRSTLESIWNSIQSTAETVWNSISATATSVWDGIKNAITTAVEAVRSTLETIWNAIKSAAETVWNAISTTATTIWEAIKSAISTPIETVKTTLATIWESIRSTAETVWNAVSGAIQAAVSPIISVIQGVINTVRDVINWFNQLMGFDGKNLASTTSEHTHTETTVQVERLAGQKDPVQTLTDTNTLQTLRKKLLGFAIGSPYIPYDNFPALLHRGEIVMTATQARKYREGGDFDLSSLGQIIQQAIVTGMENANVNAYMDADLVTDAVNRRIGSELVSRRYSP